VEISFDLVQDIFRRAAEKNCASLGVFALCEESEVFVANLGDLEEAALSTNVGLGCGEDGVDDGSTGGTSNTVVVRFPDTADCCDVVLDEVVLSEICVIKLAMNCCRCSMRFKSYH
jgi:hypothetical protein